MADPAHLKRLKRAVSKGRIREWNEWLKTASIEVLDLSGADLSGANLRLADLSLADLSGADLSGADLSGADLSGADIFNADLRHAKLSEANLTDADLSGAGLLSADLSKVNLSGADLSGVLAILTNFTNANLSGANLFGAHLFEVNLSGADLSGANIRGADVGLALLANLDLSVVNGLESVSHLHPSTVGIDTIYRSNGNISEAFLRGCGVPETFITYAKSLVVEPIQYESCFISYSHKDEDFARCLHSGLRDAGVRVWYAPEDMAGGQKLYDQIDREIPLHDRLLLVLSEHSMGSEWVMTEIRRARRTEVKQNRRKLFPIRLLSFDRIRDWSCFDADTGKDLAVEAREYFIPDFSDWKDHDSLDAGLKRLIQDLRAASKRGAA